MLFYDAYEDFYAMAETSEAFHKYCKDAFGEDFSQDGFSDLQQVEMILQYIPKDPETDILDIGCGNGKMLAYLQKRTGAYIHGFDFSEQAVKTARSLFTMRAEFREGVIGQIDYPEEKFDVIISMDSMYFAEDMSAFTGQIKKWLKHSGVFFVGYQEGDVIPKTENANTTMLAEALRRNAMKYDVTDITRQTYDLLVTKRSAALRHQAEFETERHMNWFEMLMGQTECITAGYEQLREKMTRYIYIVKK